MSKHFFFILKDVTRIWSNEMFLNWKKWQVWNRTAILKLFKGTGFQNSESNVMWLSLRRHSNHVCFLRVRKSWLNPKRSNLFKKNKHLTSAMARNGLTILWKKKYMPRCPDFTSFTTLHFANWYFRSNLVYFLLQFFEQRATHIKCHPTRIIGYIVTRTQYTKIREHSTVQLVSCKDVIKKTTTFVHLVHTAHPRPHVLVSRCVPVCVTSLAYTYSQCSTVIPPLERKKKHNSVALYESRFLGSIRPSPRTTSTQNTSFFCWKNTYTPAGGR